MNPKPILNIALIGEGKNDVGIMGKDLWQDGTVQAYVERFFDDDFELKFTIIPYNRNENKSTRGGKYRKQRLRGVFKKLLHFVRSEYSKKDFDLLVFFSDGDKQQGERANKKEAKKNYSVIKKSAEEGQAFLLEKIPSLKFVPMIPVRILECWLLGDKDGFDNIGCSPQNPILPNQPELIWGEKSNPESKYPKHYLKRILENNDFPNDTETYRNIVFNNNFQNLYKNCPISFPLFYDKMMEVKTEFSK